MMKRDEMSYVAGLAAAIPIAFGVAPYGLVFGAAAVSVGFEIVEVAAMSLTMFAAAAQMIIIEMVQQSSGLLVLLLAVTVVNVRFALYSAAMAQHFAAAPLRLRLCAAYFFTDQIFARSTASYDSQQDWPAKLRFFFGVATPIWIAWQVSSVLGALLSRGIPDQIPLDFAIPLVFLAVLAPALRTRPLVMAAACAASTSIAFAWLPYRLGTLIGIAVGVPVGVFVAERQESRR